jgi:hypothetical protein
MEKYIALWNTTSKVCINRAGRDAPVAAFGAGVGQGMH